MYAIQRKDSQAGSKCQPNILPCQIKHDGFITVHERHWAPITNEDETKTSYFRGRKLQGKSLKLPEGYQGAILQTTDNKLQMPVEEDDDEEEPAEEIKLLKQLATFDDITVWDHEALPAEDEDAYAKGVQEWIALANAIHSSDEIVTTAADKSTS